MNVKNITFGDSLIKIHIFRNPAAPEAPLDKVPSWPHWEDMDKHYLKIDLTPSLRTDYLITWENPDANES